MSSASVRKKVGNKVKYVEKASINSNYIFGPFICRLANKITEIKKSKYFIILYFQRSKPVKEIICSRQECRTVTVICDKKIKTKCMYFQKCKVKRNKICLQVIAALVYSVRLVNCVSMKFTTFLLSPHSIIQNHY